MVQTGSIVTYWEWIYRIANCAEGEGKRPPFFEGRPIRTIIHVGAQVASQHCPILRMDNFIVKNISFNFKEKIDKKKTSA